MATVPPKLQMRPPEAYPQDLARWLELFQAGRYFEAITPIEACWFPDRSDFYKGLIQLTVGMNQIVTTDLVSGPRALCIGARKLLRPYEPAHAGIDVATARRMAANALRRLNRRARRNR